MYKAVFLDRDGTINVEKNYLFKPEEFEFLPGVIEGLKLLKAFGFHLIVITNQSGIARGYYTEEDYIKLNDWMNITLKENGVELSKVYYCPHHPEAIIMRYKQECKCRKPSIGLFQQAIKDFDIKLSQSYAIGDKIRDCTICKEGECQGFLIGNNEQESIINFVKEHNIKNIRYENDFLSAAKVICKLI